MRNLLWIAIWLLGCGQPDGGSVSSVNSQSQDLVLNINDPNCELTTEVDCDAFVVNLFCNGKLSGAREATCDDCPNSCQDFNVTVGDS